MDVRNGEKVNEYSISDYAVELQCEDDGTYFAAVSQLPGCMAAGDDANDAIARLGEAFEDWVQDRIDHGEAVPAPESPDAYSGRLLVRMPKSLHAEAAREAGRQGASLNSWIVTALSQTLGRYSGRRTAETDLVRLLSGLFAEKDAMGASSFFAASQPRKALSGVSAYDVLTGGQRLGAVIRDEDAYSWPIPGSLAYKVVAPPPSRISDAYKIEKPKVA